jgi:hypothetical protein
VFLNAARVGGVSAGGPPPAALAHGLSVPEACRIRDRSTILARQLYAEKGPQLADQQVRALAAGFRVCAPLRAASLATPSPTAAVPAAAGARPGGMGEVLQRGSSWTFAQAIWLKLRVCGSFSMAYLECNETEQLLKVM